MIDPSQNLNPAEEKPKKEGDFEMSFDEVEVPEEPETKEAETAVPAQDALNHQQLRQKIENIDLDDSLKQQVSAQASDAASLGEGEKLKALLKAAKQKGVVYAVNMAKKMNDPYILDVLHDTLAKEGHYKDFLK